MFFFLAKHSVSTEVRPEAKKKVKILPRRHHFLLRFGQSSFCFVSSEKKAFTALSSFALSFHARASSCRRPLSLSLSNEEGSSSGSSRFEKREKDFSPTTTTTTPSVLSPKKKEIRLRDLLEPRRSSKCRPSTSSRHWTASSAASRNSPTT